MAVNDSRSMNMDLRLGACDGSHKSLTPSRGGEVEMNNVQIRRTQLQPQYNVVDKVNTAYANTGLFH
jgi:hypothetical protein